MENFNMSNLKSSGTKLFDDVMGELSKTMFYGVIYFQILDKRP